MMRYDDGLIVHSNPHHVAPSCQDPSTRLEFFFREIEPDCLYSIFTEVCVVLIFREIDEISCIL